MTPLPSVVLSPLPPFSASHSLSSHPPPFIPLLCLSLPLFAPFSIAFGSSQLQKPSSRKPPISLNHQNPLRFRIPQPTSTPIASSMAAPELAQTEPEGIEGVRMTCLNWPRSKAEASKCVIPIAASIQSIRPHVDLQILPYAPLRCKTCSAVLNPFCRVDFAALIWICPF